MGRRAAARVSADGAQSGAPSWPRVDSALAGRVVWFMGLHVPLGVLMHQVPSLATVHAVLTVTVAVLLAMFGRLYRVVYAVAYIAGSEMLRLCRTPEIMADAAHAMLTRDAGAFTGRFCIDEEVLREAGVTDFSIYRHEGVSEQELTADFFL